MLGSSFFRGWLPERDGAVRGISVCRFSFPQVALPVSLAVVSRRFKAHRLDTNDAERFKLLSVGVARIEVADSRMVGTGNEMTASHVLANQRRTALPEALKRSPVKRCRP